MAAQLNPLQWQNTQSLSRRPDNQLLNKIIDIPQKSNTIQYRKNDYSTVISDIPSNDSFLHSQKLKQSLLESRKAFLNLSYEDSKQEETQLEEKSIVLSSGDQRKVPSKKISFKIKKTSSIYRRNSNNQPKVTMISVNTVAELTKKFNQIVNENCKILEEPKFKKLVKRVNSQRTTDNDKQKVARKPSFKTKEYNVKVSRKPSVKTKPNLDDKLMIIKRPSVVRKASVKSNNRTNSENKMCVRAKIGYLESPHIVPKPEEKPVRPSYLELNKSKPSGSVKAAIEIFERKNSNPQDLTKEKIASSIKQTVTNTETTKTNSPVSILKNSSPKIEREVKELPKPLPKPQLPERKTFVKPKKMLSPIEDKDDTDKNISELTQSNEKTDVIDEVQIINIPAILPKKRCESMYETLNKKKPSTFLKTVKSEEVISKSNPIVEAEVKPEEIKPNASFLWRTNQDRSPSISYKMINSVTDKLTEMKALKLEDEGESIYDTIEPRDVTQVYKTADIVAEKLPEIPPRPPSISKPFVQQKITKKKMPLPDDKLYEELNVPKETEDSVSHSYEYCDSVKYEDLDSKTTDDGYEYCESPKTENIYETLPSPPKSRSSLIQQEPLPPRPPSTVSFYSTHNGEEISNCYESIYNPESEVHVAKKEQDTESNYESIYGCQIRVSADLNKDYGYNGSNASNHSSGSNRDSLISSDQQSNSLYGRSLTNFCLDSVYNGKANSDLSVSDRSEDWVDVTDNEEEKKGSNFIIVRGKQKIKKGWKQHWRGQWSKSPKKLSPDPGVDSESDHHYESLYTNQNGRDDEYCDDYDSFESESESENSYSRVNLNDSGLDIGNNQLPDPPNSGPYVLTRLAATAGKHMKKLRRNWSLTKNDISRSLSRMTKRKSRTDLNNLDASRTSNQKEESKPAEIIPVIEVHTSTPSPISNTPYQDHSPDQKLDSNEKTKSLTRKGFLNKFRRSMSMTSETATELTANLNDKPKSTFYLTEAIDIDEIEKAEEAHPDSGVSLSPIPVARHKPNVVRPQSPPPPAPINRNSIEKKKENKKERKASSWYAEAGLFRNENYQNLSKRPNTFWYAEVGLYQSSQSTPSTSSAENSGNTSNVIINRTSMTKSSDFINDNESKEEYYNLKNETNYFKSSINSFGSNDTKQDDNSISQDLHLQLQDEPLYQFYDAAVLESVCHDGISDFDSDGYEEVGNKTPLSVRPSAMELVSPKRNSICFTRTLWCEIPEVIQSAVLSTLSGHQKKLQEAKFEMLTSEASYLNSLNVLNDHFITSLENCNLLSDTERDTLFGKIKDVRDCSEKLLHDLENCWQDNILLQGVCDIVLKHAEENFSVYVGYCANQIFIDETLKKIKDKSGFQDILKQLESSIACQSLSLYSFLMLPMQRITRWPLLVDAVLKRLSQQDTEYLTCQYALATLNKIVNQCNEAARTKERESELKKIATQLEFPKGVKPIDIVIPNRWLIKSGVVTHMLIRTDETKLTFGKRFNKTPLHLFLFNDVFLVTKLKSDNLYNVLHYCPRNLVELSSSDILSLPVKDSQGRHLLFLTLLENQDEKTVEFMLSCGSESDKERWIEALAPLKSENPDETLYECWDCPQVTVIHNYIASQPDELPVVRGDVINVLRKMGDGWYHGERIRDGQTGWFPANYTMEIANPHVRARNLKQRYRLLAFSENYLKTK